MPLVLIWPCWGGLCRSSLQCLFARPPLARWAKACPHAGAPDWYSEPYSGQAKEICSSAELHDRTRHLLHLVWQQSHGQCTGPCTFTWRCHGSIANWESGNHCFLPNCPCHGIFTALKTGLSVNRMSRFLCPTVHPLEICAGRPSHGVPVSCFSMDPVTFQAGFLAGSVHTPGALTACEAFADACADSGSAGLTGFVRFPAGAGQTLFFQHMFSAPQLVSLCHWLSAACVPQHFIACWELLAQLALLWLLHRLLPVAHPPVHFSLKCDNASCDSASWKGISMARGLCHVLSCFCLRQRFWQISVHIDHAHHCGSSEPYVS